jgi:hypothetical protein
VRNDDVVVGVAGQLGQERDPMVATLEQERSFRGQARAA